MVVVKSCLVAWAGWNTTLSSAVISMGCWAGWAELWADDALSSLYTNRARYRIVAVAMINVKYLLFKLLNYVFMVF